VQRGEIDLIMRDGESLVFVEVRQRADGRRRCRGQHHAGEDPPHHPRRPVLSAAFPGCRPAASTSSPSTGTISNG
jgi:hypothetical protein